MAHKGRHYPVAFRRDFNINQSNNNSGWAESYRITLAGWDPAAFNNLNGTVWRCGPPDDSLQDFLRWDSPGVHLYTHVWVVRLLASFTADRQRLSKKCEIYADAILAGRWGLADDGGHGIGFSEQTSFYSVEYTNPAYIRGLWLPQLSPITVVGYGGVPFP